MLLARLAYVALSIGNISQRVVAFKVKGLVASCLLRGLVHWHVLIPNGNVVQLDKARACTAGRKG